MTSQPERHELPSIEELLRAAGEQLRRRAQAPLPRKTEHCPSLPRIAEAVRRSWRAEEEVHVKDCPYCQHMIGYEWRIACPSPAVLYRFVRGQSCEAKSIRRHIEEEDCARCRWLCGKLEQITEGVKVASRILASPQAPEPALVGVFALPPVVLDTSDEQPEVFEHRFTDLEERFRVVLWELRGDLVADVDVFDAALAERPLAIEIHGNEVLTATIAVTKVEDAEPEQWSGQYVFGPFEMQRDRLGSGQLAVVARPIAGGQATE